MKGEIHYKMSHLALLLAFYKKLQQIRVFDKFYFYLTTFKNSYVAAKFKKLFRNCFTQ